MSIYAEALATNHGRLLATGLHRLAGRYGIPGEDDLVDYYLTRGAPRPHPGPQPGPSLSAPLA
jgi:hypothetical protein